MVGTWRGTPLTSLALQGAWGGRRGIVTVLLIAGEGLLGCGLGVRCLLPRCRAHFWLRDNRLCAEEGLVGPGVRLWCADPW